MRELGTALCCLLLAACSLVEDVPPVADGGKDQTVKLGAPITLDASKSREIDGGRIVEYRWTIIGVPKGKEDQLNRVITTTTEAQTTVQLPTDSGAHEGSNRINAPMTNDSIPPSVSAPCCKACRSKTNRITASTMKMKPVRLTGSVPTE